MKKKIIGIFVMTLLIAAAVLPVTGFMIFQKNVSDKYLKNSISELIDTEEYKFSDWVEKQKLVASDGMIGDGFGFSVSISGDYIIIGARYDGNSSGSAYIFKYDNNNWLEKVKLTASDGEGDDSFGYIVANDGNYAVIGAPQDDNSNGWDAGSAYVFKRSGTTWIEEAKLIASDGELGDHFGCSVSIDEDYIIIGAKYNGKGGASYIFKRFGTTWTEEAKLIASDADFNDNFGISVSIKGDNIIVGAPRNGDHGSAYIFKNNDTAWVEETKLFPSMGGDEFGFIVRFGGDYAVIVAISDDENGENSGSAYMFKCNDNIWEEEAKLLASDGAAWDRFGSSAITNGQYTFIGAGSDDNSNGVNAGSVYIFKRVGTTWTEKTKLLASDGSSLDSFGCSISISGEYMLIGAFRDDDKTGSAYIIKKENQPPNKPTISGQTSGKAGKEYEYTFNATDPDGDDVRYFIDWGDNNTEWTGYNPSGTDVKVKHTWSEKGTYNITAKAQDIYDVEGPGGTLEVTMPKNKPFIFNFNMLEWFFERFPNVFPVLRYLLGFQ